MQRLWLLLHQGQGACRALPAQSVWQWPWGRSPAPVCPLAPLAGTVTEYATTSHAAPLLCIKGARNLTGGRRLVETLVRRRLFRMKSRYAVRQQLASQLPACHAASRTTLDSSILAELAGSLAACGQPRWGIFGPHYWKSHVNRIPLLTGFYPKDLITESADTLYTNT
ncbi:hypothetical protein J1605_021772 [Eschrichtius robustus]|uniref:Uncharacterized protein n=1 Tax=Eschrichtius robustus TaxID=9764 RepID=A0AB34HGV5_ESCRO|nr:hypothetical protein J1605_021772 [Eschrichtius robustus]